MKIRLWRKIMVGITFASSVSTLGVITWKVVQKNNLTVESKTNAKAYLPVRISKQDHAKLLHYKNNTYLFDLPNFEYYLVHGTLALYPELASKKFNFSVDDYNRPKHVSLEISGQTAIKWFYSII